MGATKVLEQVARLFTSLPHPHPGWPIKQELGQGMARSSVSQELFEPIAPGKSEHHPPGSQPRAQGLLGLCSHSELLWKPLVP